MASAKPRAAIYARYSSDLQSEASIEDQVALCRQTAAQHGYEIAQVVEDRAISGSAANNRPGYQAMLVMAKNRGFKCLICESPSRLARRLRDLADLNDQLNFAGVTVLTVQNGPLSELHIGFLGTLAQYQLKELANMTRRGQQGLVRQGRIPGGMAYGYEGVPGGQAGDRQIVDAEAAVIKRIYTAYADGDSANAIAGELNKAGVSGPRGGTWSHTTICGHRARGTGILNNRLYIGDLVYGRSQWDKDPETGRRVCRTREGGALEVASVDALRIIDQALWDRVQARHAELDAKAASSANPLRARQGAAYAFSGKLFCGCCQRGYQISGKDRYACAGNRAKTCTNGKTFSRHILEARILAGIKDRLLSSEMIAAAVEAARAALESDRKRALSEERRLRQRMGELDRSLSRWVDAIGEGTPARMLRDKMEAAENEHAGIVARLAEIATSSEAEISIPHPAIAEAYRRKVAELEVVLAGDGDIARQALGVVRGLVDSVTIVPDTAAPNGVWLEIAGDLGQLLGFSERGQAKALAAGGAAGAVQLSVDAGTGFEPVTFRL